MAQIFLPPRRVHLPKAERLKCNQVCSSPPPSTLQGSVALNNEPEGSVPAQACLCLAGLVTDCPCLTFVQNMLSKASWTELEG